MNIYYDAACLLRQAKKFLDDGTGPSNKTLYICYAIEHAYEAGVGTFLTRIWLKRFIRERLGEYVTVNEYLEYVLNIPVELLTHKNVQEYRHRWVNALIKELHGKARSNGKGV
jgi:hypothetical protein